MYLRLKPVEVTAGAVMHEKFRRKADQQTPGGKRVWAEESIRILKAPRRSLYEILWEIKTIKSS